MIKNALFGPKNNRMGKNETGMGKWSPGFHANKISKALREKNDKRDTAEL